MVGDLKGKRAIAVARQFGGRKRNFKGEQFGARGYAVSPVGFEAEQVKPYLRHQEQGDKRREEDDAEDEDKGQF